MRGWGGEASFRAVTLLKDAYRSILRLLVDGGRVVVNHGPQLVCLFLFGWAGRAGFLWLATVVSDVSPLLAVLLLPLAPLSTLLSLVLMLRATAPTLSAFGASALVSRHERWQTDLSVAAQVMIPFLAVYAAAGLLRDDARTFVVDATADEAMNAAWGTMNFDRTAYADGWVLVALVVAALVVRQVIAIMQLTERHLGWAAAATYLEVLWMITLANAFAEQFDQVVAWVQSRQVVAAVLQGWDGVVAWLAAWGVAIGPLLDALVSLGRGLGGLVVTPVAWLAIGAVVLGASLSSDRLTFATHEDAARSWGRIPQPVRRVVAQAMEPITTPLQTTVHVIGRVAGAGLVSMAMFCVVFSLASGFQSLTYLGLRQILGPGESLRQYAMTPYVQLAGRAVYFVVALALLAAAVNAVVAHPVREGAAPRDARESENPAATAGLPA